MSVESKPMTKVLVFGGKTGWIGGILLKLLKEQGKIFDTANENEVEKYENI